MEQIGRPLKVALQAADLRVCRVLFELQKESVETAVSSLCLDLPHIRVGWCTGKFERYSSCKNHRSGVPTVPVRWRTVQEDGSLSAYSRHVICIRCAFEKIDEDNALVEFERLPMIYELVPWRSCDVNAEQVVRCPGCSMEGPRHVISGHFAFECSTPRVGGSPRFELDKRIANRKLIGGLRWANRIRSSVDAGNANCNQVLDEIVRKFEQPANES